MASTIFNGTNLLLKVIQDGGTLAVHASALNSNFSGCLLQ